MIESKFWTTDHWVAHRLRVLRTHLFRRVGGPSLCGRVWLYSLEMEPDATRADAIERCADCDAAADPVDAWAAHLAADLAWYTD